jgi:hypothetical protein
MPPGGLSKLCPLDSRHRLPIRIVLLYVCWRVENGSAQWKKNLFVINLIWKYLLSTKWKFQSFGRRERCFHWNQNGKWQIVVIWEHSGAIFVYISSITCALCKTSSDWIRVLVALTNEILKREFSKCILDLPSVERRGTRIVTLG